MLTSSQQTYLLENKILSADTLERVLKLDDPQPGLTSKLAGALDAKFRQLREFVIADDLTEFNRTIKNIAFITRLPLDIDVSYNNLETLKKTTMPDCRLILEGLYMLGAKLDPEIMEMNLSERAKGIQELLHRWNEIQRLTADEYYLDETVWQNIQSIEDIKNPGLSGTFNAHANAVQTADSLYMQAARAGQFSRILDIYKNTDAMLDLKTLLNVVSDDGITLLEIICHKQEDDIYQKLLDPSLWRGNCEDLQMMWEDCLPESIKQDHPLEGVLQNVALDAKGRIIQQYASKPLARRVYSPQN